MYLDNLASDLFLLNDYHLIAIGEEDILQYINVNNLEFSTYFLWIDVKLIMTIIWNSRTLCLIKH